MEAEKEKPDWKTLSVRPDIWNEIKNNMKNTESYNEWCKRALESIERVEKLEERVEELEEKVKTLEENKYLTEGIKSREENDED